MAIFNTAFGAYRMEVLEGSSIDKSSFVLVSSNKLNKSYGNMLLHIVV